MRRQPPSFPFDTVIVDAQYKKYKMCTEKRLTKKIFFDILIKVGLKSREKIEKTRYYFVLLSE